MSQLGGALPPTRGGTAAMWGKPGVQGGRGAQPNRVANCPWRWRLEMAEERRFRPFAGPRWNREVRTEGHSRPLGRLEVLGFDEGRHQSPSFLRKGSRYYLVNRCSDADAALPAMPTQVAMAAPIILAPSVLRISPTVFMLPSRQLLADVPHPALQVHVARCGARCSGGTLLEIQSGDIPHLG